MIKRFDRLEIITSDLDDASRTYAQNFGFTVQRAAGSDEAVITIGDAQMRLRSGAAVADLITTLGEGLGAIWLEADDVESVAAGLSQAGIAFTPLRRKDDRRVISIDPKAANLTPLYIFDRRP
jgi:predicted enzyme related to lactoylglutathione lyase